MTATLQADIPARRLCSQLLFVSLSLVSCSRKNAIRRGCEGGLSGTSSSIRCSKDNSSHLFNVRLQALTVYRRILSLWRIIILLFYSRSIKVRTFSRLKRNIDERQTKPVCNNYILQRPSWKAAPPPTAPISHQKEECLSAEKFTWKYSYPEALINLGESYPENTSELRPRSQSRALPLS